MNIRKLFCPGNTPRIILFLFFFVVSVITTIACGYTEKNATGNVLLLFFLLLLAHRNTLTSITALLFLFCCALYAPAGMTYGKINNSFIVALLQTTTDEAAEFTGMIPVYHFLVSAAILVFMVIFWRTHHRGHRNGMALLLFVLCSVNSWPLRMVKGTVVGIAGPGLLARVLTSKYAEHTPLYRQSEIYGRQGVELRRSLLSGWVDACCRLLSPLEEALHGDVMTDGKLHADDTPVQVLLPGNKKTKTGRLWAYVRDDRNAGSALAPAVWFAYSPDRKGIHPQTHLACFSGVLQADAYAGFNELYRNGGITEAACWAHARRKIHDVHVRIPSALTEEALEQIGQLYAIEADIRGMPAEQRLAERQRKTKPLLKSLESWLREKMKTL
ncbi:IS66 family transposase, partial [Escherichia coli]|nr:IS66 family transposase [Escherichia coli]